MPSGTIRCAKCSPTIPTLPGRSATTIVSFCADLRKWRNWASTRKRQCLVGIVIRAESRRVFAVHTSRMQVGVFTCRGHQPMLERRPFGAVGVASFEGSKFTVVVRDSSANLCRQWPSAHPCLLYTSDAADEKTGLIHGSSPIKQTKTKYDTTTQREP